MQSSDSVAKLAGALSKAQGKFKAATKDAVNPHFKNRYADLASIWDAIREPLSSNGLAVVQGAETSGKEALVTTTLIHESGEWVQTSIGIPITKPDAQGVGSAITYGRRYGLTSLVGITQDDDDGETAVGRGGGYRSVIKGGSGGGPGSAPNGVPGLTDVVHALQGAGNLDTLKAVWEDAQQFSKHPDFAQIVKAKDEAKARLSTAVPARVTRVVKNAKPLPDLTAEPVLPGEPINEDDIPFA
jgi:hypothetical protein